MIDGLSGNILSKAEKDELEELRKWLEKKLASLPTRTKRVSKKPQVDDCCQHLGHAHGDGAAGIRRQIVTHFHCISCDRPLELEIEKVLGTSFYDAYRSPRQCGGEHTTTSPESRLRRAQMALGYAAIENGAASPDRLRKSTVSLPPLDKVRPQSAGGMGHATMSDRQAMWDPVDGKTKKLRLVALTQENELQDFPTAPEPSAIYEGESEGEWDDRVKQQSAEVSDRQAVTLTPRSSATIRRSLDASGADDVKLLDVETPQVLKEQEDPENSEHISEDHPVDPGEEKDP
ncbi:unnamed protein product [Dibothriocephalus latus]|uniref:DUF4795 domain-containing protein n=1 Tax=Dibothriocephalus latus TaxID=60516 RepID=A0A3P6UDT7_DIBLA|nr:unnamed protein product [Dibothriocephalus latus]